jgi:hypothetical protein
MSEPQPTDLPSADAAPPADAPPGGDTPSGKLPPPKRVAGERPRKRRDDIPAEPPRRGSGRRNRRNRWSWPRIGKEVRGAAIVLAVFLLLAVGYGLMALLGI